MFIGRGPLMNFALRRSAMYRPNYMAPSLKNGSKEILYSGAPTDSTPCILIFAFISYLKFVRGRAWDKEEEQPEALLSPFEAGPEISLFLKLVRRSRTVSYGRY